MLSKCGTALNLLGFNYEQIRQKIDVLLADFDNIGFDTIINAIRQMEIHKSISYDYDDLANPLNNISFNSSEYVARIILILIKNGDFSLDDEGDKIFNLQYVLDEITPYEFLFVLINNNLFIEEDLIWEYQDLMDGGWIDQDTIDIAFSRRSKFLIITEGSTDTLILKNAFEWLMPENAGFFDFIDMKDNYPFTGVGNIVNFYHGLLKIEPKKKIIILFDNDTAGHAAIQRCTPTTTKNFLLITLPDMDECEYFRTIGPSGIVYENINGRAVSIEIFLDLDFQCIEQPAIRWTSFDSNLKQYQGSLQNKDQYTKKFIDAKKNNDSSYDIKKILFLLDYIIESASKM
jgi:hypothetical protein